MSRIGKLPIHVPAGVTITIKDNVVTVKGPKGEMTQTVNPDICVTLEDGVIHLARPTDDKNHRALHGLYRSLINNQFSVTRLIMASVMTSSPIVLSCAPKSMML